MLKNPPLNDKALDLWIYAKKLAENPKITSAPEAAHAIKSIGVVGAIIKDKTKNYELKDLLSDDQLTIVKTLEFFSEAGIPIGMLPAFHFYNILPPIRSDFLQASDPEFAKELPKHDLVIMSMVKEIGTTPQQRGYFGDIGYENFNDIYTQFPHGRLISSSPLQDMPKAWAKAAHNLEASFIVTRGGLNDEISPKNFEGDERFATALQDNRDCDFGWTMTGGALGLIARKNSLPRYEKHLDANSTFGTALLAINND